MRPNYKALAMYYRRRFLDEGKAAASWEFRCKMADEENKKCWEEIMRLRERNSLLEAAHWVKSQIEGGHIASDAAEVRQGKWELHKDGSGTCSECHFTQKNVWDFDDYQNFCGHCGAKMDAERREK